MSADYKDREYKVVPYSSSWTTQYGEIAEKLASVFGTDAVDIQHIGSTSVPGMSGKPTIDVLVLVNELGKADTHIEAMERAGFQYVGQFVMEGSRLFRIMEGNTLIANIHIFPQDHPHVRTMIGLRNYLRTHPEEVAAYSDLKNNLHNKYPNDYASYRKEKDAYMDELKERVMSGS